MNLNDWCAKAEAIGVPLRIQYWNMQVGLPFNQKKIGELEGKSEKHAELFLKNFKEPADLLDDCVGSVAGARTYKQGIELNNLHQKAIVSQKHTFKGKPVTWQTWRQFAATASDNARKDVYDEFIALTPKLTKNVSTKFATCGKIFSEHGTTPLDAYVRGHRMTTRKLREVITELRDGIKKPFAKRLNEFSQDIFGRAPEYYDDFYVIRNKIYDGVKIPKINPIKSVHATLTSMGLNPAGILLDDTDRPKKYASPFMYPIQVPQDVRVSYKPENPVNDLNSVYHEYGHAIHYRSIRADLPYWTRNSISEGLAETWSIFFERLLTHPSFLRSLGINAKTADDLIRRTRFNELYAAAFYCANSLFKIDSWEKSLPFDELSGVYAKHIKDCMGLEIPGEYWLLHHILPESLMYVPSYMLAEMQVANLHKRFGDEHGASWWTAPKVGKEIYALLAPGNESPCANFSKINPKEMIRNLTHA